MADKLPKGYADENEFLKEARERFQQGVDADKDNRDAGLDDLKFLAGEQWDETVRAARLAKGRPCLTINTLPQFVGQVIGDTRTNRPSIKVRPAEEGDKKVAEVRQGLIRHIENQSNATQVYALAGEDQVSCGLGHFRVGLEYTDDDAFDQDIRIRHIPNPFAVVWDPLSVDPTGADARFCFVVDEVDKDAFKKAYPEAQSSELTVPVDANGWVTTDSVRVTEYWVMKDSKRKIALVQKAPDAQPTIQDITENEEEMAPFIVPDAAGNPRVREVVKKHACMYLITGKAILEGPYEYPISRVPVFKVTGREVRVADRRYRFGLIRFAKDAVRMKNLWRSSAAEWLAQAPKQQWLLHASDEAEANRYRNAGKSGDTVLTYSGQIPPSRIDPPSAPSALLQEAQFNDQDIKDTTGLHDASLGMKSNETSGKAIMARERQGDVATFMYHDNLNLAVKECGRVVNDLLPVVYDTARTVLVLGEDDSATPTRINDPNAEEHIDLGSGKYDIIVETGPSYATKRVEAADSMMQFMQAVPTAAPLVGDLVAQAQDWPMADKFAERLKKGLPPQFQDDEEEGEEPNPAKQQAMQAQQMQMQQAQMAQQMQMAEAEAKVQLTRAQAAKIMAEAQAAGQPSGEGPTQLDQALQFEALRKAKADADKAEAEAERARIAVAADLEDLKRKPLERAHSAADLDAKRNPTPEGEPA